jgi:predicted AlkP superfamily phosphohydrolase/phosphomutase
MKVAVIGLDSAAPELVFERWREELPHLSQLMDRGLWGRLESVHPPITVPAWACMVSSRDPGQFGIYGFRNRRDHSYQGYAIANASAFTRHEMVWDILGQAGKQVILLGVPPSYPPRPVNGIQVGCFLTPPSAATSTYPAELRAEIEQVADGYVFDVEGFRTDDKAGLLERVHAKTRKHFAVARHLLTTRPWDFFMMVEMGVDRIHHGFWKYMDPTHPKFEPGNPYQHAIRDYYRAVDGEVGELLALLPEETAILVVSDHGAKKMDGGICFNEWLIRQGYLTLSAAPTQRTPIDKAAIDWSRTKAWGDGGYYGRLFLNVKGREPQGIIDPGDVEKVRSDLIAEIEAIQDPAGRPIGSRAYRPEELYRECRGVPPDLIVYFGNLDWRSVGAVGLGTIHTFENDTGPDDANHAQHGICILADPRYERSTRREGLQLLDIAPTILSLYGLPAPATMGGRAFA